MRKLNYELIGNSIVLIAIVILFVLVISSDLANSGRKDGILTCYSDDGQTLLFSEYVTDLWIEDVYTWHFTGIDGIPGGISMTRPCGFEVK